MHTNRPRRGRTRPPMFPPVSDGRAVLLGAFLIGALVGVGLTNAALLLLLEVSR